MWVCGARSSSARSCDPVSTPATTDAPALYPLHKSLAVSPTTATSRTSSMWARRMAQRTMSGYGRPRTVSLGARKKSVTSSHPRCSMMARCTLSVKPVVRQTLVPAARNAPNAARGARDLSYPALADGSFDGRVERGQSLLDEVVVGEQGLEDDRPSKGPSSCGRSPWPPRTSSRPGPRRPAPTRKRLSLCPRRASRSRPCPRRRV